MGKNGYEWQGWKLHGLPSPLKRRVDYANTERELCISSNLTKRTERVILTVVFQVHMSLANQEMLVCD